MKKEIFAVFLTVAVMFLMGGIFSGRGYLFAAFGITCAIFAVYGFISYNFSK